MNALITSLCQQRRIVAELDTLQAEVDALKRLPTMTNRQIPEAPPAAWQKVQKLLPLAA